MSSQSVFDANPYTGHASLSPLEAEVLWEYAKLNQHIKDVSLHKAILIVAIC